jgi:phage terminase large subunit-like protein
MAQQIPSQEFDLKNKQFNIWTAGEKKWLNMERWMKCDGPVDLDKLERQPCHLGIDLSSIQDITAVVSLFPPGDIYDQWAIYPRLYLPEERLELRERDDRVPYRLWKKQGHLITTPGDVIDLAFIRRDILDLADRFNVIDCGFDPWKAIEMATSLEAEGLEMVQMRQGHATLGAPTQALEKLVLEQSLRHGGHPVLSWMAANTTVIEDPNNNIRPNKKGKKSRIDGIVALVMAIGRAMVYLEEPPPGAHVIDL